MQYLSVPVNGVSRPCLLQFVAQALDEPGSLAGVSEGVVAVIRGWKKGQQGLKLSSWEIGEAGSSELSPV